MIVNLDFPFWDFVAFTELSAIFSIYVFCWITAHAHYKWVAFSVILLVGYVLFSGYWLEDVAYTFGNQQVQQFADIVNIPWVRALVYVGVLLVQLRDFLETRLKQMFLKEAGLAAVIETVIAEDAEPDDDEEIEALEHERPEVSNAQSRNEGIISPARSD
jgi:hypothetical protein